MAKRKSLSKLTSEGIRDLSQREMKLVRAHKDCTERLTQLLGDGGARQEDARWSRVSQLDLESRGGPKWSM